MEGIGDWENVHLDEWRVAEVRILRRRDEPGKPGEDESRIASRDLPDHPRFTDGRMGELNESVQS